MKNWLTSKTLWFNILTVVATLTGWGVWALTSHPTLLVGMVIVNAIVNFCLRFVTTTAIK